jgi:hypothetical protein
MEKEAILSRLNDLEDKLDTQYRNDKRIYQSLLTGESYERIKKICIRQEKIDLQIENSLDNLDIKTLYIRFDNEWLMKEKGDFKRENEEYKKDIEEMEQKIKRYKSKIKHQKETIINQQLTINKLIKKQR